MSSSRYAVRSRGRGVIALRVPYFWDTIILKLLDYSYRILNLYITLYTLSILISHH